MLLLLLASSCAPSAAPPAAAAPAPSIAKLEATPPPAPAPSAEPPPPALAEDPAFATLFLSQEEVGADMQLAEESETVARRDRAFAAADGERARMARWVDPSPREVVQPITDVRWVFPDEARARAYFTAHAADALTAYPQIEGAPSVGAESRVLTCPAADDTGPLQGMYMFYFRVGRVVASVSVSRGYKAPEPLTSARAAEYARRAAERIERAQTTREWGP